jgi:dihydroxy-acid dehydratase
MEDFYYAGGLRALLAELAKIPGALALECGTANGKTLRENIAGAMIYRDDVIRTQSTALFGSGTLAILYGNLCPDGAVIKPAAAESRLLVHTGRAVVFEDYDDLVARIDAPALAIDKDSVIVLKNAGPLGAPGMPEWGQLPIPKKLLLAGVRDMLRISDARMSGTSYGACVLHVAPESFAGGPLALVQEGDRIALNVPRRRLDLLIDDAEMARRKRLWQRPKRNYARGYGALFEAHVTQANLGCDFDFLEGTAPITDPEIH